MLHLGQTFDFFLLRENFPRPWSFFVAIYDVENLYLAWIKSYINNLTGQVYSYVQSLTLMDGHKFLA